MVGSMGDVPAAPAVQRDTGAARQARRPADGAHDAIRAAHAGFT
ncbi:hypothetical protein [Burkholderia metallica]